MLDSCLFPLIGIDKRDPKHGGGGSREIKVDDVN